MAKAKGGKASPKPAPDKGKRHGGARPNSGPKPRAVVAAIGDANAATIAKLTSWLPDLLNNLKRLADGGYERVERKFELRMIVPPPGTFDVNGRQVQPYEEMVMVERKVEVADADRLANEYLINRLLGKPTEKKEISGPDGGSISIAAEKAIETFYGETGGDS